MPPSCSTVSRVMRAQSSSRVTSTATAATRPPWARISSWTARAAGDVDVEIGDRDVRPSPREPAGDGRAVAARASGDERDLPGELRHGVPQGTSTVHSGARRTRGKDAQLHDGGEVRGGVEVRERAVALGTVARAVLDHPIAERLELLDALLDRRHRVREVMEPLAVLRHPVVVDARPAHRLDELDLRVHRGERDVHLVLAGLAPVAQLGEGVRPVRVAHPGADAQDVRVAAHRGMDVVHQQPDLLRRPPEERAPGEARPVGGDGVVDRRLGHR